MDRRTFIKLTAVTGGSTTLASCGNPEEQLIRFVPDEEHVPGVAEWKPSVCPLCSSGCGLTVRVMEADVDVVRNAQAGVVRMGVAKKLEGNPEHPVNHGALCARGQAAIQVTYHPDRIRHPLKRSGSRGDGKFEEITWDQAINELVSRLDVLESNGKQAALTFITRAGASLRNSLIDQFASRFGALAPVAFELFGDSVLRRANDLSFGHQQLPTFDLARARYVLSFGADFLGTWNSPVAHGFAYGQMRRGREGVRGSFVQVEARMTQTGASADEWVPVKPGTEGTLALGLAHVILKAKGLRPDSAGEAGKVVEGWSDGLVEYSPDRVETLTGVPARRIERLAREFSEHQPALAIIGGPPLAQTNALFSAVAVNALNALVGSVGAPGGIVFTPQVTRQPALPSSPAARSGRVASGGNERAGSVRTIDKFVAGVLSARTPPADVVVIDGADPVFATPRAWRMREALEKVPFIASFGSFVDDTSVLADLILPDHSFLESWVESRPESGSLSAVVSLAPPVMKPLHQTRATPDVLLEIGRRLKRPIDLGSQTFEEMLQTSCKALPQTPDSDVWLSVQKNGGWWGELPKAPTAAVKAVVASKPAPIAHLEPRFDGDPQQFPYHFLPFPSSAFLDGSLAHLPWLQEMPDPMTSAMWSSWIEINSRTAERLGVQQGDIVEVASQHGSIRVPAFVSPAIAPDLVAMPVGQGHQTFTRFASGRGENPISILAPITEPETGSLAWAATRVRIARVSDSERRLILFAGSLRENPHEGETR